MTTAGHPARGREVGGVGSSPRIEEGGEVAQVVRGAQSSDLTEVNRNAARPQRARRTLQAKAT